jgi:hypothetical protein
MARNVMAQDGLAGFYRGLTLCLIRAFPSNAGAFLVYEGLMRSLGAEKVCVTSYLHRTHLNRILTDPPLIIKNRFNGGTFRAPPTVFDCKLDW